MGLRGKLSTMPLAELLQWLGMARKTGALEVQRGSVRKTLYLRDGRVVGSVSDDPNEMLGQFLLAQGAITEEQLRQGLRAQETSKVFLGKILVGCGVLGEEEMSAALVTKTEETIYSLFEWDEASFEFRDGETARDETVPVSLRAEDVVLRGVARYDENRRIRTVLPDGEVVLARTDRALPRGVSRHPLARRIIDRVDGRRSVDEIMLDLHTSPYQVRKFLYEAHRVGLVTKVEAPAAPPPGDDAGSGLTASGARDESGDGAPPDGAEAAAGLVRQARRLSDDGEFDAALTLLQEALAVHPESSDARALQPVVEQSFMQLTYRLELPPDSVPALDRSLDELIAENLRPEEFYLVSRIDGVWDLKSIIEIAPMREVDALRVLKRLLRRGLIRLGAGDEARTGTAPR